MRGYYEHFQIQNRHRNQQANHWRAYAIAWRAVRAWPDRQARHVSQGSCWGVAFPVQGFDAPVSRASGRDLREGVGGGRGRLLHAREAWVEWSEVLMVRWSGTGGCYLSGNLPPFPIYKYIIHYSLFIKWTGLVPGALEHVRHVRHVQARSFSLSCFSVMNNELSNLLNHNIFSRYNSVSVFFELDLNMFNFKLEHVQVHVLLL